MRTTKDVIDNSNIPAKLVRAVIRQLGGKEDLEDIMNHGVDGGFHGFITYSDTVAFFKRNRADIAKLVEDMASDLGETPLDMVAGFNCLGGRGRNGDKAEYYPSVSRCLYGGRLKDDDTQVANALAWFAAEEVARVFCDE